MTQLASLKAWIEGDHPQIGHPDRRTLFLYSPEFTLQDLIDAEEYAKQSYDEANDLLEESSHIRNTRYHDQIPESEFYDPSGLNLHSMKKPVDEDRTPRQGSPVGADERNEVDRAAVQLGKEREKCIKMIAWYVSMREAVKEVDVKLRRAIEREQTKENASRENASKDR